jgi:anthranilate/para-aminobenzoate synthase component I
MATSILIRTFVADGRRLTLHVGGGITWRSTPDAEWDETVAKATGPLSAIDATEVEGRPARADMPAPEAPLDATNRIRP